jgi:hypothetical protein
MAYGRVVAFDELREAGFAAVAAGYTAIGGATSDYARLVAMFNSTDTDVYISLNGVTNHIRLASGTGQIFDFTTNKVRDDGLFVREGTVFYQKRAAGAPSVGSVWIEVVYATGGV